MDKAEKNYATALSVLLPKDGRTIENVKAHKSMASLLQVRSVREATESVFTVDKSQSHLFYSICQVSSSPHATGPLDSVWDVQTAAAEARVPFLNLVGTKSVLSEQVTVAAPGNPVYEALGCDRSIRARITPEVFAPLFEGVHNYSTKEAMNEQAAKEHVGEGRNAFNIGFGWAGHSWKNGKIIKDVHEFAPPNFMHREAIKKHFPDKGRCLGVFFEALGLAQDALLEKLGLEERTDPVRNANWSGEVGEEFGVPGCQAGECLFFSIECSRSALFRKLVLDLKGKLKKTPPGEVDPANVSLHVDAQNPVCTSPYARVSFGTWIVHLKSEGELCPIQVTCHPVQPQEHLRPGHQQPGRRSDAKALPEGPRDVGRRHAGVRYEDDGLALYKCATPIVISYLGSEFSSKKTEKEKKPGCFVGHVPTESPDGENGKEVFQLVQGETTGRSLETVGDQPLRRIGRWKRAPQTSARSQTADTDSAVRFLKVRAYVNKFGSHSSERGAAQMVGAKFVLNEQQVWQLLFGKLQHFACPALFVFKCLSLVRQWDKTSGRVRPPEPCGWRPSPRRGQRRQARQCLHEHDFPGAEQLRSHRIKRVHQCHIKKTTKYTPEFCSRASRAPATIRRRSR